MTLRDTYSVPLEPPPAPIVTVGATKSIPYGDRETSGVTSIELLAPEGYVFGNSGDAFPQHAYRFDTPLFAAGRYVQTGVVDPLLTDNLRRLAAQRNTTQFVWRWQYKWKDGPQPGQSVDLAVQVQCLRTAAAFESWQSSCFGKLAEAERQRHDDELQRLLRKRDELRAEIDGQRTLSLRKVEREELMKGVLRWLLGPSFSFYPQDLPQLDEQATELPYYDPQTGSVLPGGYDPTLNHGANIRFLHHAIEWENMNYVLYPYFWTDHERWDVKQRLNHVDDLHWSFLRAGAARVVLTIRPGFEEAWLRLVEAIDDSDTNASPAPYMTLAEELRARADEYDPRSPTANPTLAGVEPIDTWYEFTPTGALDVVKGGILGDDEG